MDFTVANRTSPSEDLVYVRGGRKADLIKLIGKENFIRSEHDWGNWRFLIKRDAAKKVGIIDPDWNVYNAYSGMVRVGGR